MALIDAATMLLLQSISEDAMPDVVTIERYGAPVPVEGGGLDRGSPVQITTKCRVSRFGQVSQHQLIISLPLEHELEGDDVLHVVSTRLGLDERYNAEPAETGSYAAHRQALLKPVE